MRESVIEAYLARRVKDLGGEVRKLKWIGRRGAPDRIVFLNGMTVFVELKATGEVPEPHQAREHTRMRKMGVRVEVIDSKEGVEAFIRSFEFVYDARRHVLWY